MDTKTRKIMDVQPFFDPALPQYLVVLGLLKYEHGDYTIELHFGRDEIHLIDVLSGLRGSYMRMQISNQSVIITVIYPAKFPPSVAINAVLKAQAEGLLPT